MNENEFFFDIPDSDSRVLSAVLDENWMINQRSISPIISIAARHNLDLKGAVEIAHQREENRMEIAASVPGAERLKDSRRTLLYDNLAVVPVFDSLVRRGGMFSSISGAMSMEDIYADYQVAQYSPKVERILLDIDSPGGSVSFTEELSSEIQRISQVTGKPVEAFSSGMQTSAAQWIASAAQYRTVTNNALVGNIGVLTSYISRKVADERAGIKRVYIVSSVSPNKLMDPETVDGLKDTQNMINALGENFVTQMSANLGVSRETILKAKGRVVVGKEALKYGFADAVSTRNEVMSRLMTGKAKVVKGRVNAEFFSGQSEVVEKMELPEQSDTIQNERGEKNSMPEQNHNTSPALTEVEQNALSGGLLGKLGLVRASEVQTMVAAGIATAMAGQPLPVASAPANPEPTEREKSLMADACKMFVESQHGKITTEAGRAALSDLYSSAQEFGLDAKVRALMAGINSAAFTQDTIPPADAPKTAEAPKEEQTEEQRQAAFTASLRAQAEVAAGAKIGQEVK